MADRRMHPWKEIVDEARAAGGKWILPTPLVGVLVATSRAVNEKRAPQLHLDDGRLEADPVSIHEDDDGRKRCDLWVRFVALPSDQAPTGDTNRREHEASEEAVAG